ncbi:hypothetical protein L1987_45391 [Smallanthus sonchifolius]|uniref:Uncharacterized protein n=1 Tax=Smallanthus sonchifolius TaxID=185202 RepID=A0ACB9GT91_9ASTR|nr:hypothetical protein L1987_45391 [Smallanthus sonchifolius]
MHTLYPALERPERKIDRSRVGMKTQKATGNINDPYKKAKNKIWWVTKKKGLIKRLSSKLGRWNPRNLRQRDKHKRRQECSLGVRIAIKDDSMDDTGLKCVETGLGKFCPNNVGLSSDGLNCSSADCSDPKLTSGPEENSLDNTRGVGEPMQQEEHEPTRLHVMDSMPSPGQNTGGRMNPFPEKEVCVDPQIARTKGKGIMEDGFIKVKKKKKKNNGPKPRVQIPSLHLSKPGPSKPLGRARPNVITRVTVSNPFEALDDVNQIDDGFPELNATLKKFAMRYVKEKTIPEPDVFKTWSTDLKEYYYSLIKDDGEEVESETDGTAKRMSTGVS